MKRQVAPEEDRKEELTEPQQHLILLGYSSKRYCQLKSSVNFYKTFLEITTEDSEENIGIRRMYADLMEEEKQYVERFRGLIAQWENKLNELSI